MKSKIAVIDVGSNSVRLMYAEGENVIKKEIQVTKIAKGLVGGLNLQSEAIERTARALSNFYFKAKDWGAKGIYAFCTEAVRKASNKAEFLSRVFELCGIVPEVISGEEEALLGINGALKDKDGMVIDIGGASTEIIVREKGKIIYSKSLNVGVVTLTEKFGQNPDKIKAYLQEKLCEYGEVPKANAYGIGGTATSLAGISIGEDYNPKKVNGYKLCRQEVDNLKNRLYSLPVEERKRLKGLQPERAEVIASGATLLNEIMKKFEITLLTVSEGDNLEGYLYKKISQKGML